MKVKNLCLGDTYVVTHPCTLKDYCLEKANYQKRNSVIVYPYGNYHDGKFGTYFQNVIDGEIYSYGFPIEAEMGTEFIKLKTLDFNAVSDMLATSGYTKKSISKRKLRKILKSIENKKNEE